MQVSGAKRESCRRSALGVDRVCICICKLVPYFAFGVPCRLKYVLVVGRVGLSVLK